MNTRTKVLISGIMASLFASVALNAATYYIGGTAGAHPLGGVITNDALAAGPTAIWDLSTAPVDSVTGERTVTLTSADTYILERAVFVKGGTLKINAGTVVRGQPATNATSFDVGTLVITRGAKIVANGDAGSPVIFTTASTTGTKTGGRASGATPAFWDANPASSPRPLVAAGVDGIFGTADDVSASGLWGGLVILGNSISNVDRNLFGADNGGASGGAYDDAGVVSLANIHGGSASADDRQQLEGISASSLAHTSGVDRFGGNDTNDNSGVLRYVSIRYCGSNFSSNSEVNGLTLGAVGAGTTIDYVEVFGCTDDLFEVFGGTVNLKHLVGMGGEDDMFDFDAGFAGTAQFLFGVGYGKTGSTSTSADYSDRAFEWDGSYRLERPEGYRTSPEASRAINAGGLGAVVASQSNAASVLVANATTIGLGYSGTAVPVTVAGNAANNDHSCGIMLRDQAVPFLKNSIILPNVTGYQYGIRVATMGTEDYTATIKRLENLQALITNNTFYKPGAAAAIDFTIGTAASTAAGANNAQRDDVTPARIVNVLTTLGTANVFNTDPGFTITVSPNYANALPDFSGGFIDPRPLDAYSSGSPVVAPTAPVGTGNGLENVSYRGAFPDDPFSPLWTTGWTAANKLGIIAN